MGSNTCRGSFGTYTKDQYIAHIIEIGLLYTILQSPDIVQVNPSEKIDLLTQLAF